MTQDTHVKTILVLAANPTSTARLRLDEEVREIEEGLRRANKREQFKLEQRWAVRLRDFYRTILDYQPQIVHFCGHGAGVDGIVLEDEVGQPALVNTDALAGMFEVFATNGVECAVFNACFSKVQAEAISQHINYVIGMSQALGDRAAIDFAVAFYDALVAGQEVELAFKLGCSQLIRLGEHLTPELKKRAVIVPTKSNFIPPNPYQGLFAFSEKDAGFFYGREKFVEILVKVTYNQPLVTVIGSSGSGKSSVVFAGLIPQLRVEKSWLIESFRPGDKPFYQLASALVRQLEPEFGETKQLVEAAELANEIQEGKLTLPQVIYRILEKNPKKHLLLVADQFEELYTLCHSKKEQQHFVDTLLEAINQKTLTLVLPLRADFYDDVLSYPPFGKALQQFTPQLLLSMSEEELKAAIEQPAQKLKIQLQTHLAERILNDVGQEPGNLPLLEFTLTELWKKQQNKQLTHQAYDEIGGVKQALIKHAEQVYSQLSNVEQQITQSIFLSLVNFKKGTKNTRRLATRTEIGEENWQLVVRLAGSQARLVVTGGHNDKFAQGTVEVIHEILIQEWQRLREWLEENQEKLIRKQKIEAAAIEWRDTGKSKDYLLQGKLLKEAKNYEKEQTKNFKLSELASDFILHSIRQRRSKAFRTASFRIVVPLVSFLIVLRGITPLLQEQRYKEAQITIKNRKKGQQITTQVELLSEGCWGRKNSRIRKLPDILLTPLIGKCNQLGDFDLSYANIHRAKLRNTDFRNANLSSVNLSGADLRDADLTNANLFGADLRGADLRGANLTITNLTGANLGSANLEDAKNLKLKQVKLAKNWQQAIYDPEFRTQLGLPPESTK